MYLKFKKCDEVIKRKKALQIRKSETKTISNKQLELVCEEETAYKIMKKLDNMYLKESTALEIVRRNRLEKLRLRN